MEKARMLFAAVVLLAGLAGAEDLALQALLALPAASVLARVSWLRGRDAISDRLRRRWAALDLLIAAGVGFVLYAGEMGVLAVMLLSSAKVAWPWMAMHVAAAGITGFLALSVAELVAAWRYGRERA